MNFAVLLSGGVDSSVVVHLLCEQGYRPSLFYIKIGRDDADYMDCSAEEDMEMASAIARRYGLSLEVVDLHREYWDQVAAYAIDKIRRGLTPNPDVMCNKLIKFGCFEQRVGKDFDITATGHYATTVLRDGKTWLGTAADSVKDQTDFLAQIDYLQVSKLMFPLGRLMKNEVRDIALRAGLPSARRRDSQGICFHGSWCGNKRSPSRHGSLHIASILLFQSQKRHHAAPKENKLLQRQRCLCHQLKIPPRKLRCTESSRGNLWCQTACLSRYRLIWSFCFAADHPETQRSSITSTSFFSSNFFTQPRSAFPALVAATLASSFS